MRRTGRGAEQKTNSGGYSANRNLRMRKVKDDVARLIATLALASDSCAA